MRACDKKSAALPNCQERHIDDEDDQYDHSLKPTRVI